MVYVNSARVCAKELVLFPWQTCPEHTTLNPETTHWFRAGSVGAVVSEFSTRSTDDQDVFTDLRINRFTKISE